MSAGTDLTALVAAHQEAVHGRWIASAGGVYMLCACGYVLHPVDWPAHVASVVSAAYTITPKETP